jgi:hypothetical protein
MELPAFQSFIKENAAWFGGVRPESHASLERAETQLGCRLPASLKWLLAEWGYSGACGVSSLADAVNATLRCRGAFGLPEHFVILNDWGDVGVVYLDSRNGSVTWTNATGVQGLAEGLMPSDADAFVDFPAWVASRLETEKEEA